MSNKLDTTIREFFKGYPQRHYAKGEAVFNPGDSIKTVLYMVKGSVVEYDISTVGNEVVVNVFKRGAFFPMSFAMNPAENEYFFEAAEPMTAHVAPANEVLTFLKDNPDVLYDLLGRVFRGVDGILRRMAHLMGGSADTRLIFELVNAAHRYGTRTSSGASELSLTEGDLAKRSGLSRETVNRTMRKLKDAGLVKVTKYSIQIPNLDRLEQILGTRL